MGDLFDNDGMPSVRVSVVILNLQKAVQELQEVVQQHVVMAGAGMKVVGEAFDSVRNKLYDLEFEVEAAHIAAEEISNRVERMARMLARHLGPSHGLTELDLN